MLLALLSLTCMRCPAECYYYFMRIPPLPPQPVTPKSATQTNAALPQADRLNPSASSQSILNQLTNLQQGVIYSAKVAAIKALSRAQQQLLQATANKPTAPTSNTTQLSKLAQQSTVQRPQANVAVLTLGSRSVLTITNQNLQPGQTVAVQLSGERLSLLPQPAPQVASRMPASAAQPASASSLNAEASPTKSPLQATPPPVTIATHTRRALPLQTPLHQALKPLLQLQQLLNAPPLNNTSSPKNPNLVNTTTQTSNTAANSLLPTAARNTLQQLIKQLPELSQLSQPTALRQALQQSGALLEKRLLQANLPSLKSAPSPTASINAATHQAGDAIRQQDTKGLLLQLSRLLAGSGALAGQASATSAATTSSTFALGTGLSLGSQPAGIQQQLALQLLQRLFPEALRASDSSNTAILQQAPAQLIQSLQAAIQSAIARLQWKQLQSVSTQESVSPWLQLELPARHQQELIPIDISVRERYGQEQQKDEETAKEEDRNKISKKRRQWQVRLSLELPHIGPFHCDLLVQEQQVSATLWAENTHTAARMQGQLQHLQQQLEQQDITVDSLRCFQGKPQRSDNTVNTQLVDIKT